MPSAEIITIGTEILLGEILDTNAQYIARRLRDLGVDLYRKSSVGDNFERIAQEISLALQRCDIVLTTGGLGPTVDDPTRQAVAQALGTTIEFHPELWEQIQERFMRYNQLPTDNNKRQAYLPEGAEAIENPVGTAPAFFVRTQNKVIICLPGVPSEMEYLFDHAVAPLLVDHFSLKGIIKTRLLHTVGVGESRIDDMIGDLETLSNPTVGLSAHSGQVDVRITAKADSETNANALIAEVEMELRNRIGKWIYGVDRETLEEKIFEKLHTLDWSLSVVEFGLHGTLIQRLSNLEIEQKSELKNIFLGGTNLSGSQLYPDLGVQVEKEQLARKSDCCLGVALQEGTGKQTFEIFLITPSGVKSLSRSYGGPSEYAIRYAIHNAFAVLLDIIS